jgi:serine/threonine-protein kinase RsbW
VEISMMLYLPRDAASVPVSRQVLDGCLEVLGVAPGTRTDIALALTEACANVIQHAGPGDEFEVRARAVGGRCVIEVVNAGSGPAAGGGGEPGPADELAALSPENLPGLRPDDELAPPTAEHGRGLKIMGAVVDNLRLTGNGRSGTTVHFEKPLSWVPDAPGEFLLKQATAPRGPGQGASAAVQGPSAPVQR